MFFLFWHRAKDEEQGFETVTVPCKKCGAVIQGSVTRRTYSGILLVIPYRFHFRFIRCMSCGHRQKLRKGVGVYDD